MTGAWLPQGGPPVGASPKHAAAPAASWQLSILTGCRAKPKTWAAKETEVLRCFSKFIKMVRPLMAAAILVLAKLRQSWNEMRKAAR